MHVVRMSSKSSQASLYYIGSSPDPAPKGSLGTGERFLGSAPSAKFKIQRTTSAFLGIRALGDR